MPFFPKTAERSAVVTTEKVYKYDDLNCYTFNSEQKEIVLIMCRNMIDILGAYISAMNSNHAVMLMASDTHPELLQQIIAQYKPKWIVGMDSYVGYTNEQQMLIRLELLKVDIHADLALLLSTSGTTGSQKFVRLSYENVRSNAQSIVTYLTIDEDERAVMNLPLSYSYGMSIVNSHLFAGATILLTEESVMEKTFWDFVKRERATSLAGVPFTYQMLQRIGLTKMELPHLTTLTQAGGRLNEKLVRHFGQWALQKNKRFYVMYGQTEASPRMSYIPCDKVLEKADTIGVAIPGGQLSVEADELVYRGDNVMMGYAHSLEDLSKGDEMGGVLYTGDTAKVDEDGYFKITGRMKRFIKLFGLRINLDEVEKKLEAKLQTSLACTGSDDKLIIAIEQGTFVEAVKQEVEALYKLHKSSFKVKVMDIPRFANGKTDYITLKEQCL